MNFTIPGKLPSAANLREHWATRAERLKAQRKKAMLLCPKWTDKPLLLVRMTRHAPKALDGDNLQFALKGIRDGVAARLRIDDGSPLVEWEYRQDTCAAGAECVSVRVEAYDQDVVDAVFNPGKKP